MLTEQQLEQRRQGIGASEAAAICGLNPWQSALAVYLGKIGELPQTPASAAMEWGNRLEAPILDAYAHDTGLVVCERGAMLWHADNSWMFATLGHVAGGPGPPR